MSNLLVKYKNKGLLKQKGAWYYYDNKNIGHKKETIEFLKKLDKESNTEHKELNTKLNNKSEATPPDSSQKTKAINPALNNNKNTKFNPKEIYEPLSHDLEDIENYKKSGRFKKYIFGVDAKLEQNPVVSNCDYVFRHRTGARNVNNGKSVINRGWKLVPKNLIKPDPRTGKAWLTVARDDSAQENFYSVGGDVLCYAKRASFKRKKARETAENLLKVDKISLRRKEKAIQLARMSKDDVEASFNGYKSLNNNDNNINNNNNSLKTAQALIDNLDPNNLDKGLKEIDNLVNSGQLGGSLKSAIPLNISEI
jgi:hypothetical protein